mgnify:FL=1|jgi:hypothetical protein
MLLLSACTSTGTTSPSAVPSAATAAALDTATTALALAQGARELNPLGFWGVLAGKITYFALAPPSIKQTYERTASQIWTTAALHNLLQLALGGTVPVPFTLGLSFVLVEGWFNHWSQRPSP